jgi:timeless
VALLSELMHLLHAMYNSKEPTEQIMSMGLMEQLFYGSDPVDRLPKLLSKWLPGTSTREYLCDLVEVTYMTIKLLEESHKRCKEVTETKTKSYDTVEKMKANAADFDVSSYFLRKIVSNQTVFMYTHLLERYAINSPHTNHRVIALFLRMSKMTIAAPDPSDADMPKCSLEIRTVTLEPMLFNVSMFTVCNKILNDVSIRNQKDYSYVISFASGLMKHFAAAAQENPMLFVEALVKHNTPHRFCELSMNMYVEDELRMLAERELLMEEQHKFDLETEKLRAQVDEEDSDDEEELEFEDFGVTGSSTPSESFLQKQQKSKKQRYKKRKNATVQKDDTDSESEIEFATKSSSAKKVTKTIQDDSESESDEDIITKSSMEDVALKKSSVGSDSDEEHEMKSTGDKEAPGNRNEVSARLDNAEKAPIALGEDSDSDSDDKAPDTDIENIDGASDNVVDTA